MLGIITLLAGVVTVALPVAVILRVLWQDAARAEVRATLTPRSPLPPGGRGGDR